MRSKWSLIVGAPLALLVLAIGCAKIDPIQPRAFDPASDSGSADFSVLVTLGDSFSAGTQNAGLLDRHQVLGFSAQLATQLGKQPSAAGNNGPDPTGYVIAGVSDPGTAGTLRLVSLTDSLGNLAPELDPVPPAEAGSPTNTGYQAPYNNIAVVGATVGAMLAQVSGVPSFDLVLRRQGRSMVEEADLLNPTFVVLWAGVSDVLQRVLRGEDLTPVDPFQVALEMVVDGVLAFDPQPGIVMANVPDLTQTPYAGFVPPIVIDPATGKPVLNPSGRVIPLIGPNGSLALPGVSSPNASGDLVTVNAIPLLQQGIGIPQQVGGTDLPLPETMKVWTGTGTDSVTVTVLLFEDDVAEIRLTTLLYNEGIAEIAALKGIPVVDMWTQNRSFFDDGFVVGGIEYTGDFLSGGIYSLDGIHYTDMAQAMVANEFIRVINGHWGSRIPSIGLAGLAGTR